MIPKYIIDLFKLETDSFPCISEIKIPNKELLLSLIKKATTIWYFSDDNDIKQVIKEEYLQYDETGIYIYYTLNENGGYDVFILSKINKRDIVDFTLHILKKQIKNYGNNDERITGKD